MVRTICHIDMDAFYASVEQRDRPELRGKPVIVGGSSMRGVVTTASYEARRFGIHSAMPLFQARKRCPQGIYLPVRMARYREMSHRIMTVLEHYSPLVEQVSIDEAFVDISGLERLSGPPEVVARAMKGDVFRETSLSCSIGIAPNKFLAKIASDMDKPDGLTIIPPNRVAQWVKTLPIKKVPGVGGRTLEKLKRLKVVTLGDLEGITEDRLIREVGKFGRRLAAYSRGLDDTPVVPSHDVKSISCEETLSKDSNDLKILRKHLLGQSESIGRRLRSKGLRGNTVTLKLKRSDFLLVTRALTLKEPTDSTSCIYEAGVGLLEAFDLSSTFRLIGIGVSRFVKPGANRPKQLGLFDPKNHPADQSCNQVDRAVDAIKGKFGKDAIKRGSLLS